MNYQGQLSLAERYQLIQEELFHQNLEANHILSKTEFYQLLDSRISGRTFDRGIAAQLYERMNKDAHGDVSVDSFIRVYIEAQDFLTQNILQTQQYLQEYETQRLDAVAKLQELRQEEVLNSYGIMENSILTIQVLDLRDVNRAAFREVYVAINCGDNVFETEPYPYTDGMEWSDQFNIEIKTGMEVIQISIVALGANNQAESLGEIVIPVRELGDQFFRDEYFDLLDARRNPIGGQIHLKLQWIHSRVKYLENVIRKWEESIQVQLDDREDFEQSLNGLNELFPSVPYVLPPPANVHPEMRLSQQNRRSHPNDQPRENLFQENYQPRGSAQQSEVKRMSPQRDSPAQYGGAQPAKLSVGPVGHQDVHPKESIAPGAAIEWKAAGQWGRLSFIGTLALLVLTMFTCFMKASFIELILCVGLLKEYDLLKTFRGTLDTMKLQLGILVVAILWSIVWLALYTSGWGGKVIGWEPEKAALVFVLVIEYFSFFLKLVLGVCYFNFYQFIKGRNPAPAVAGMY